MGEDKQFMYRAARERSVGQELVEHMEPGGKGFTFDRVRPRGVAGGADEQSAVMAREELHVFSLTLCPFVILPWTGPEFGIS